MWIIYFLAVAFYIAKKDLPICGKSFAKSLCVFFVLFGLMLFGQWQRFKDTLPPNVFEQISIGQYLGEGIVIALAALFRYFIFVLIFKGIFKIIKKKEKSYE